MRLAIYLFLCHVPLLSQAEENPAAITPVTETSQEAFEKNKKLSNTEEKSRWLHVPNRKSSVLNQLHYHTEACGPTSMLNAMAHGDAFWVSRFNRIPGDNDHDKIEQLINTLGKKLSKRSIGEFRWDAQYPGTRINDLRDMINEASATPKKQTTLYLLFREEKEQPQAHLQRIHKQLHHLLSKGLPPPMNIERAYKHNNTWFKAGSHMIVLYAIPESIAENATSFPIKYIDPYGGHISQGELRISNTRFYANMPWAKDKSMKLTPALIADFPNTSVYLSTVPSGKTTVLYLQSAIGMQKEIPHNTKTHPIPINK